MKVLLFDPHAGASGDMIMASLIDLGANIDSVRRAVESVGCDLEISREERGHITACRVKVISDKRFQSLGEAESILRSSSLTGEALQSALAALDILADAESHVHGATKEEIHFHEIGALDALADIAGACAARQSLKAERVLSGPISVGGGLAHTSHGLLPVPSPAALEILRANNIPWRGGPVEEELLTPTGAALMAVLVDEFRAELPLNRAESIGYGAGRKELAISNVLRSLIAEAPAQERPSIRPGHGYRDHGERVVQLETNVDDVTGEVLGHLIERLMTAGALDVSILPALMKKGRAGSVIRAIARHEDQENLAKIIIRETGSLGVRVFPSLHRFLAERDEIGVDVELSGRTHRARVKISRMDGEIISVKPEYEDCKRIAEEADLPLRAVSKKVEDAGWQAAVLPCHPS